MTNGNSISIKLTRFSVGIAVALGILMSIGELIIDIEYQKTRSKDSFALMVNTVSPLASKVAYELNTDSAEDVILGLFAYPTVLSGEILGDKGQVLAKRERLVEHTIFEGILNWFFSELETFEVTLLHENYEQPVGLLNVKIDITQISTQVIDRFMTSLVFGILRNIILAIVLLIFFQRFINRPILSISKELSKLELASDEFIPISNAKYHDDDELGALISSINSHLKLKTEIGRQLHQSQRMKALGQLTGRFAHDFNNILGTVMGNLELAERKVTHDKKLSAYMTEALTGVNRGAELTRKLLNYSSSNRGEEKTVSVNEIVSGLEVLISKSLNTAIKTEIYLGDDIWHVKINTSDLQDAILNLSQNAGNAMPNGGKLTIETSNKILDENYIRLNPETVAGEYVMITVSDTGIGMNSETRNHAIEPFFTKADDSAGLGLSILYNFIRRSGGSMKIYSDVGVGTTIHLYLPRDLENGEGEDQCEIPGALPNGNETILIVDDEQTLVNVATENLESLGYNTLTANSGDDALKVLSENTDIDLIFSDVIMPGGTDGYQLAIAAHKMRPSLKILLTSGFIKKLGGCIKGDEKYLNELTAHLLGKPYNRSELAQAVRKALDEEE